jgi:hypothetical protein
MSRIVVVKVGSDEHKVDLNDILHIHNADAERHTVASDMAWWGVIAAAAQSRVDKLTAAAASWHAAALVECLKQDEKMSEWKAKANASGHPEYNKIQNDIADAQEMASRANTVHWALVRKMDMLKEMIKGDSADRRGANDIGRGGAPAEPPDPRLSKFRQKKSTTDKED